MFLDDPSYLADDKCVVEEFIENEMQFKRRKALQKLSQALLHPEALQKVGQILAYSFFEEQEQALDILKELNINLMDILALQEDFKGFEEEYTKEKKSWLNC